MIERFQNFWAPLNTRDRVIVLLVAALFLGTLLYIFAIEGALKARKDALQSLPTLQEQAAQMDAMAAEAALLKAKGSTVSSPEAARQTLSQALDRAGLKAERVAVVESRVVVSLKATHAGQALQWLETVTRENRLKIASSQFNKPSAGAAVSGNSNNASASKGLMDIEVVFDLNSSGA